MHLEIHLSLLLLQLAKNSDIISAQQRRRSGCNFGRGKFQRLEGKQRPEDLENCHYRLSILNTSVTNRNVREQFTADCDMSI